MTSQTRTEANEASAREESAVAGPSLLDRFHRHLHGRYVFAAGLGLLAALAGAYLGYRSAVPTYRSTGVLRITPLTLKILYAQTDVASSVFEGFVEVQINSLRSRPVIMAVLDSQEWQDTHSHQPAMDPEAFLRNLEITHQPRSELIDVSFTDSTPVGAQMGVRMLIESYMKISGEQSTNQRIQSTQERGSQLSRDLDNLNKRIGDVTQKYGTDDLKQLHQAKVLELGRLESMIMDTDINLALAESALGKSDAFQSMPASEIASTDEIMRRLLEESQRAEEKLAEVSLTRGKDHPDVVAVKTKLATLRDEIKARMEAFHKFHRSSFVNNAGVLEGVPTPASVDALKERRDKLRAIYHTALQKSLEIGGKYQETAGLLEEARKTRERLADNQSKIEQLRVDASIGLILVVSTGDLPREPLKDRRRVFAGAGALGGFGLGFAVVAALACADPRLRRTADLAAAGIDVPVLGTFPKFAPLRGTQAAYALHEAVTYLQIDPELSRIRVFALSSARPGQGKSELAAALAVGFAALGKRTLLVDFDHRSGLLTKAFLERQANADSLPTTGLSDVLAGAGVTTASHSTCIKHASFLPSCGTEPGRIGALTSAQVHDFLARAASEFEIVLLDTPPILEGLESALICKEAESLLFAATPATSDRDVARALALLGTAEAVVGGILFSQVEPMKGRPATPAPELSAFRPGNNGSYITALMSGVANDSS